MELFRVTKRNGDIWKMQDQTSGIHASEANANPRSFNLSFSLEGIYEGEDTFAYRMKISDEMGIKQKVFR